MTRQDKQDRRSTSRAFSVGFISLGCAKNLVDSQIMADCLLSEGIALAPDPEAADVVLVNTCSFIRDAREESEDAIASACAFKAAGQCRAVIVAGCLPQRYRESIRETFPEVDAFIGLDELREVGTVIRRIAAGESGIVKIPAKAALLFEPRIPGVVLSRGPYAYLKIAEGCDHKCAFCAIPGIRGTYRSRQPDNILKEAENLVKRGFRELNLISQDTMSYGKDLKHGTGLPRLLAELGRLDGRFWIRILYGHPSGVTDELLDVMASTPAVCRYLDLAIQHSHPDILRGMGRAGTVEDVRNMVERIRRALPGAVLRTTCLVGFPGEKDEHFRHLCDFIKSAGFDHLGVFVYSPEEGTGAFRMNDRPAPETAEQRRETLLQIQREIVDSKAGELVGKEDEVLLEKQAPAGKNVWSARSRRMAPEVDGAVLVEGVPEDTLAGTFVRARYTAAAGYDMKAAVLPVTKTDSKE